MRNLTLSACLLLFVCSLAQGQDVYDQYYRFIRSDDLAGLKQLLDKGLNPNAIGPQKMTPLLDAALIGSARAMTRNSLRRISIPLILRQRDFREKSSKAEYRIRNR